jgi:L-alanine-DL-glutamate epimerase-like enolase superfamily enzyme
MAKMSRRSFLTHTAGLVGAMYTTNCFGKGAAPMSAKIVKMESFPVMYPTQGRFKFFEDAEGKAIGRPTVVVKITAEDGTVGWGQSVPVNKWSYETLESVHTTILKYLRPVLVGKDAFDLPAIEQAMNKIIAPSFSTGQPICKAGIDLALFDLTGKIMGQSATQRWQRKGRDKITLSWTLNPRELDDVPRMIEEGQKHGYNNFNIKVGPNLDFDLELCRQVKKLVPEGFLWADANGGYDEETALQAARKLADAGAAVLEQPLKPNHISGYRKLKKQAALPILMDEGVVSTVELEEFIKLDMLDGVAMKPARCGGLSESARQIEMLLDRGMMWLGSGLTDPDISLAASLLLYGAFDYDKPAALNGPQFLASRSILTQPFEATNGEMRVPQGDGLCVEVDEDKLHEYTQDLHI